MILLLIDLLGTLTKLSNVSWVLKLEKSLFDEMLQSVLQYRLENILEHCRSPVLTAILK